MKTSVHDGAAPEGNMLSPSKSQDAQFHPEPAAEEEHGRQETVYLSFEAPLVHASESKVSKKEPDGPILDNDANPHQSEVLQPEVVTSNEDEQALASKQQLEALQE